jgi:hypothetical protein
MTPWPRRTTTPWRNMTRRSVIVIVVVNHVMGFVGVVGAAALLGIMPSDMRAQYWPIVVTIAVIVAASNDNAMA